MKFNKYTSLTNHYQDKFINLLQMNDLTKGDWIAQEKIHGANFSFHYNGSEHKQAKRSGFCDENFFNCQAVLKYRLSVELIYRYLVEHKVLNQGEQLVIFGELFGGKFNKQKEPNAKTVQGTGADYHPDNEFMAFDIKVNDKFLPFIDVESLCKGFKLPLAPVVAYGDFKEMMELNNEFDTFVPEDFGLERLKDNTAEGLVIRPYIDERTLENGTRILIKSKNSKFSEKRGVPAKIDVPLDDNAKVLLEDFTRYFTEARVDATISKVGQVENWKQFAMIAELTFKDAIEDYEKDNFNGMDDDRTFKSVLGDNYSLFNKQAKFESDKVVRGVFKRIL